MIMTRSSWRRPTSWLLLVIAIGFSCGLALPYLNLDITSSRLGVRDGLHYGVLVAHIFTAAVALTIGPLQFMPKVRRHKRVHRILGRLYLLGGVRRASSLPSCCWPRFHLAESMRDRSVSWRPR